jgi:hypothetical protein
MGPIAACESRNSSGIPIEPNMKQRIAKATTTNEVNEGNHPETYKHTKQIGHQSPPDSLPLKQKKKQQQQ